MRRSSCRIRSTRSSALRCPSCRRKTVTICSRLLERLPPAGFSLLKSGRAGTPVRLVMVGAGAFALDAERLAAAAGRRRLRVLDREAAAGHRVDEIDLGTLQVA